MGGGGSPDKWLGKRDGWFMWFGYLNERLNDEMDYELLMPCECPCSFDTSLHLDYFSQTMANRCLGEGVSSRPRHPRSAQVDSARSRHRQQTDQRTNTSSSTAHHALSTGSGTTANTTNSRHPRRLPSKVTGPHPTESR